MEKTTEMKLTKKDIAAIQRDRRICQHCGRVFATIDPENIVCEDCVYRAMVAEGFAYKP